MIENETNKFEVLFSYLKWQNYSSWLNVIYDNKFKKYFDTCYKLRIVSTRLSIFLIFY